MKIVIVIVGLACAGLVGALAANVMSNPDAGGDTKAPDLSKVNDDIAALRADLARLKQDFVMLENERVALPVPAAAEGSAVAPAVGEGSPVAALDDEALREKVLAVVKEKETEERASRSERRAAMEAEHEKQRLARLEKELMLDAYQKEELGRILAKRRAAMSKLREQMFSDAGRPDPTTFQTMREEFGKLREAANEEIKNILNQDQFEQFQKLDNFRGPGGGGGGGRGRGGGGR